MGVYTKKYFFQTMLILLVAVKHLSFVECDDGVIESCPQHCSCDVYEYEIHVNCSGQDRTEINSKLSEAVLILDQCKHNFITISDISCSCFNSIDPKMSYNAIYFMNVDVFNSLIYVDVIDLCSNCLTPIDKKVFTSNIMLCSINLKENNLTLFPNESVTNNESMKSLNLRNTQYTSVGKKMICEIPKLVELNLWDDLRIVLNSNTCINTQHPQFLDLNYNFWKCAEGLSIGMTDGKEFLKKDTLDHGSSMDETCFEVQEQPDPVVKLIDEDFEYFPSLPEESSKCRWFGFSNIKHIYCTLTTLTLILLGSIMCGITMFLIIHAMMCACKMENPHADPEPGEIQIMASPIQTNRFFLELPV
ncbi:uncharacterized protein LOC119689229 isoform X2 [Teleopsis dalmanni]|uniref:uncharacterized protein LOC119689229 isoform X2 n=1 Tax=Teleopsis dalmanni TaxID=139649 RepID=UPI0018CE8F22|nr:uncharacterized protein LOC119689229 isoform X2 [Teleopsis dalmanni]